MESSPIVNGMVPVATGRASAAIEPIQRVLAAVNGVSAAISCWANLPAPIMGLLDAEQVMRGGALHGPVLLNGGESTRTDESEVVLRGGHLKNPHIFTDLVVVNKMQFITLHKWADGLCLYLTGAKPSPYPLKHVSVIRRHAEEDDSVL